MNDERYEAGRRKGQQSSGAEARRGPLGTRARLCRAFSRYWHLDCSFALHQRSVHWKEGRRQAPQNASDRFNMAYCCISHRRDTWPSGTFSTCSDFSHSSETPSICTKARFAKPSTSVVGLSIPAIFISVEANLTAVSAPET